MSNYPDDINMYNDDPRSPLYDHGLICDECEQEMEQDIDCDDDGFYIASLTCVNSECSVNNEEDDDDEK